MYSRSGFLQNPVGCRFPAGQRPVNRVMGLATAPAVRLKGPRVTGRLG